ncbi:hypothetical protein [Fibrella aquatica]|uniref:hypothetical protein n=1 Tax=Fibrella aquatica TaxID=3242487 RepID=UPI0035220A79
MKTMKLLAVALLLSAGAYAQTKPAARATITHKGTHRTLTTEQRATMKAERKAKFEKMTPAERKAFKTAHRAKRQAKLDAMPADKRAKIVERQRNRKVERKQVKVG